MALKIKLLIIALFMGFTLQAQTYHDVLAEKALYEELDFFEWVGYERAIKQLVSQAYDVPQSFVVVGPLTRNYIRVHFLDLDYIDDFRELIVYFRFDDEGVGLPYLYLVDVKEGVVILGENVGINPDRSTDPEYTFAEAKEWQENFYTNNPSTIGVSYTNDVREFYDLTSSPQSGASVYTYKGLNFYIYYPSSFENPDFGMHPVYVLFFEDENGIFFYIIDHAYGFVKRIDP